MTSVIFAQISVTNAPNWHNFHDTTVVEFSKLNGSSLLYLSYKLRTYSQQMHAGNAMASTCNTSDH